MADARTLFGERRNQMTDSIRLTVESLQAYGPAHEHWALGEVLGIQAEINASAAALGRPPIDLLNPEEEARIRELVAAETWPDGWTGEEPTADVMLDRVFADGTVQPLLRGLE